MEEEFVDALRAIPDRLGRGSVGQAAASREPVEVADILDERNYAPRDAPMLLDAWLSVSPGRAASSRRADHGRIDDFAEHRGVSRRKWSIFFRPLPRNQSWRSKTRGCSGKSRIRAARSRPPTGTSRNFSPTCRTSCARRSMLLSVSLKSWERECLAS